MIKDLIKLPVTIYDGVNLYSSDMGVFISIDTTNDYPKTLLIAEALCTLINAQNADVGTLAEYIAEFSDWYMVNRHKFSEPTFKGNIEIAQQYISENPIATIKSADVGKLAEEYAYKMYPKADDHANVRMRQALRESLKDAVLYGSTHSAEKEKGYEWLSPVKSEREYQEQILKRFFPEYPNICHWQVMNALIMCLLKNENIERSAEKESTLNSGAKELQLASLRPLRELAEDKEMCEEIARLLGVTFIKQFLSPNKKIIVIECYTSENTITDFCVQIDNNAISFGSSHSIQNCIQICQLISSRYKIES